jgi:hypothetical protein
MENAMTLKTLSAIAIVTAALSSPAFAQDSQDSAADGAAYHKHAYTRHLRNSYNQAPLSDPGYFAIPRAANDPENDFDRSRIGDHDPDFNPAS